MLAAAALLTCLAAPAAAQDPADPNPGAITISGAVDFTNAYLRRSVAARHLQQQQAMTGDRRRTATADRDAAAQRLDAFEGV